MDATAFCKDVNIIVLQRHRNRKIFSGSRIIFVEPKMGNKEITTDRTVMSHHEELMGLKYSSNTNHQRKANGRFVHVSGFL